MAMKQCPDCGERYSDSYKYCPFCEEEEVLRQGKRPGGRRSRSGQEANLMLPILAVSVLFMSGLLIFLLKGGRSSAGNGDLPITPQPSGVVTPDPGGDEPQDPAQEDPGTEDPGTEDPGVMPDDPDLPGGGSETPGTMDYDTAMALPSGLNLSTTDFTLRTAGEEAPIRIIGGSGSYTWISQDPAVATVDSSGLVKGIARGTVNVVVTDGKKKGVCIVRCAFSGTAGTGTGTGGSTGSSTGGGETSASGSLKTGSGKVVNAGKNGVFVRSGPGTGNEAIATLTTGTEIKIVESAGNNWYKITFSGNRGVETTGYMRGDYLSN